MRTALLALGLVVLSAGCSKPEFFEMQPTSVTLESRGATRTIRAVAKNSRGEVFPGSKASRWTSADEKVATVDDHGVITAVGPGHTVVKAFHNGMVGEVLVDVNTVEALEVEPKEFSFVQDGDPQRPTIRILDVRGKPLEDRLIRAKCEDEKICTIDRTKQIWPHNPGETTVVISCDGHVQKLHVEVAARR